MNIEELIPKYHNMIWHLIHKYNIPPRLQDDTYSEAKTNLIQLYNDNKLNEKTVYSNLHHIVADYYTINCAQVHYGGYTSYYKHDKTNPINLSINANYNPSMQYDWDIPQPTTEYNKYNDIWSLIAHKFSKYELKLINLLYQTNVTRFRHKGKVRQRYRVQKLDRPLIVSMIKKIEPNNHSDSRKMIEAYKCHLTKRCIKYLNATKLYDIQYTYNDRNAYNPNILIIKQEY